MTIFLDAIKICCPTCNHHDFRPPAAPLPAGSPLTCGECGQQSRFADLLAYVENNELPA